MARSATQHVESMIGELTLELARLRAENEALHEQLASQPTLPKEPA